VSIAASIAAINVAAWEWRLVSRSEAEAEEDPMQRAQRSAVALAAAHEQLGRRRAARAPRTPHLHLRCAPLVAHDD